MTYLEIPLFIDGEWVSPASGEWLDILDPATENACGRAAIANEADLERALASAENGFKTWRATSALERSQKLLLAAQIIRESASENARIMTAETGKPLGEATAEFLAAADQFEWYAGESRRIFGSVLDGREQSVKIEVRYDPVGVVLALTAWNFPALLPARKMAAALAAGCSVIVRPSDEAPGSCAVLVKALQNAGIPAGTVVMVTGPANLLSNYLLRSSIVQKLSFTGSTPVGQNLLKIAAEGIKRVSMELGGHAPVIVFDDCDVHAAARMLAAAKFRNAGQVCVSPSRFYVQHGIYDKFLAEFSNAADNINVGVGSDTATQMGPLTNAKRLRAAKSFVDDAIARGARIETNSARSLNTQSGYFFAPTVLSNVPDTADIMRQEPFCPVAPVVPFTTLDEAIQMANATEYGLAGYVFTSSLHNANESFRRLHVGMLGINDTAIAMAEAPFGGVKMSGMGREGGTLGIFDYLEPRYAKMKF